jgi:nicotinamidase/pyrazinamidase
MRQGIRKVYLVGLATDYCVKFTAVDAVLEGFEAVVITDATRAVDANPGDYQKALDQMVEKGVKLIAVEFLWRLSLSQAESACDVIVGTY